MAGRGQPGQLAFEPQGRLFFGDNLEVLRRHVTDDSVDLVYLDPPFNSNRAYNVLFSHRSGRAPAAQVKAFDDTWRWDMSAARTYEEVVESGGDVSRALRAFRDLLGTSDMLAYLTMMAPRLVELHRVMRSTASLYLHCDPTASHYLKIILDAIFGPENFRNDIVWKRSDAKGDAGGQGSRHFGRVNDHLLFYAKSPESTFLPSFRPMDEDYVDRWYRHVDPDGRRYKMDNMTGPGGAAKGNPYYEVMGVERYWRYSKQRMKELIDAGRVVQTKPGNVPMMKRYLDESRGVPLTSNWSDISFVRGHAAEKLPYPTQKPLALLERIVSVSSNPGAVVLDPFCGCGTAIDAAQKLGRQWIGIDITTVAIDVIRARLDKQYPNLDYALTGEPSTLDEAEALAELDKYEFQRWACERLGIMARIRKGADRGIDGEIVGVLDDGSDWRAIVSVKGGRANVTHVRDLRGTIARENADIGILVALRDPTAPMRREAADAGFVATGEPRMQLLTVADLIAGKKPELPVRAAPGRVAAGHLRAV